jgi:hypothetical protein
VPLFSALHQSSIVGAFFFVFRFVLLSAKSTPRSAALSNNKVCTASLRRAANSTSSTVTVARFACCEKSNRSLPSVSGKSPHPIPSKAAA